jgi:hypothetical protein
MTASLRSVRNAVVTALAPAAETLEGVLRRTRATAPTARPATVSPDDRRARDRAVAAANRWAADQPRPHRTETHRQLDARAAEINAAFPGRSAVVRIGLRLHAPAGLRLR